MLTSDYNYYGLEISYTDLKNWVDAKLIPKEFCDLNKQVKQKTHNELQNQDEIYDLEASKHSPLTQYILLNKAKLYGENVLKKIFSKLSCSDSDLIWLSFVKEAILSLNSSEIQPIHFYTASKILKEKYNIEDFKAVNILAKELLKHCKNISNFKSFQYPIKKNLIDIEDLNNHLKCEKKRMLQTDAEFIDYLKTIGKKGERLAIEVEQISKELFKFYEDEQYSHVYRRKVWGLWICNNEPINGILILLTQALWEDECIRLWERDIKGSPSLVKPILERIIPILNPKKSNDQLEEKFIEKDGTVIFFDQFGEPLLTAPAVDINMISAFKKGVKQLGTLTGHKILRWQVNTGFEQWSKGENDPRLIEIDGGYSKIAELTKCASKTDIAKIKEILHVQAYGRFIFPDGSQGNMISFRIDEKYRNNEPSKIRIVLGDMLLPTYVCQFERSDRRLIPIGALPPLYGSPNSHANQAQLQLLIFAEFSNQSDRLAQSGSVLIPIEKWRKLASEAGLNPDKIETIISYWCNQDLFNCFLDRQGNEYRLASHYKREQKFLEIQGRGRIINSERGKKSIKLKNQRIKKI